LHYLLLQSCKTCLSCVFFSFLFFSTEGFCVVLGLLDGKYNVLPQQSCYMVGGSEEVI